MEPSERDFNVGEEVFFEGERYVIAGRAAGPAYRYRLLATAPEGARVVWATATGLERPAHYTAARDDTAQR